MQAKNATDINLQSGFTSSFDVKKLTEEGTFEGYASVFNNQDEGNDIIAPGAFKKTLKKKGAEKIRMLWQHQWDKPIGVWDDAFEDSKGLFVKGRLLTELHYGKEALTMLRAGALDAMSIGYRTVKATRDEDNNTRTLTEIELWEVSLVTFPMNTLSRVTGVKGLWDERMVEEHLRDAGLSKEFAKNVVLFGVKRARELAGDDRREADDPSVKELTEMFSRATNLIKGT